MGIHGRRRCRQVETKVETSGNEGADKWRWKQVKNKVDGGYDGIHDWTEIDSRMVRPPWRSVA